MSRRLDQAQVTTRGKPARGVVRGRPAWGVDGGTPIELIGNSGITGFGYSSSSTAQHPSTEPGVLLLAHVGTFDVSGGVAIPEGWTRVALVVPGNSNSKRSHILVRPASEATQTTFTWDSPSNGYVNITAWSGVDLENPVSAIESHLTGLVSSGNFILPEAAVTDPGSVQIRIAGAASSNSLEVPVIPELTQLYTRTATVAVKAAYGPAAPPSVDQMVVPTTLLRYETSITLILNPA